MFEADRIGLKTVLAEVEHMAERDGYGCEPAPLLIELARSGKSFAGLSPQS
jgi:3-hydroxyacyl-CoA dehydrogenase